MARMRRVREAGMMIETYVAYICPWCMKEYPLSDFKEGELPVCSLCETAILEEWLITKIGNKR